MKTNRPGRKRQPWQCRDGSWYRFPEATVAVDVTDVQCSGVAVLNLTLHWRGYGPGGEYLVATVRFWDDAGPVTRDFHNRCGSWMTDRTAADDWPRNTTMRDRRFVAEALQELLSKEGLVEQLDAARKHAEAKGRGWQLSAANAA